MNHTVEIVSLIERSRWCSMRQIRQLQSLLFPRGLQNDNHILSRLITACSAAGDLHYAAAIFSHAANPNLFLYNTIINLLAPSSQAIHFYNAISASGLRPDVHTIPFVLKSVAAVDTGRQIHCHAILTGLSARVSVATALVRMYSHCGRRRLLADARKVFDELPLKDFNLWNSMIAGYAKADDMDTALELFGRMPCRNLISWACVVSRLARMDRPERAIVLFETILAENVESHEVVLSALISACAELSSLELGKRIHCYIVKRGFYRTLALNNALVEMYAKSGDLRMAFAVFESIEEKSAASWTTIMAGLAIHGIVSEVIVMLARMGNAGIKPNKVAMMAVLSACGRTGLVNMARWYFDNMESRFGVLQRVEHYGCIIDMLGRAGYVEEAMERARAMPFEADTAIWESLLAACNIHGNAELGEIALKKRMGLEPLKSSGLYTLLPNIYAKKNLIKKNHK